MKDITNIKEIKEGIKATEASKFENLDKIDKSLGNNTAFNKLAQEEIENLHSSRIFKEIESIVKNLSIKKQQQQQPHWPQTTLKTSYTNI